MPYLFLKASSSLAGAFDDIEIPRDLKKIDWEAEIALVISKTGKRIKAERALDHVAGFMTTNDVSCRDQQMRSGPAGAAFGLARRQEPRQFCADGAVPRPARLRAGPHEFVHPARRSTARSSRTATPRNSSSRPRSRSNTRRTCSRSKAAIFFSCGTCGGVGQGTNTFLKVGDVHGDRDRIVSVDMRNRFVAESS